MRLPTLLLQILVALSLALNGPGLAMAESHPAPGQGHATVAAGDGDHVAPPCHDGPTRAPKHYEGGALHDTLDGVAQDPPARDGSDCCGGAAGCGCACVSGTAATTGVAFVRAVIPRKLAIPRPVASAHAEPAVADINRPPIG